MLILIKVFNDNKKIDRVTHSFQIEKLKNKAKNFLRERSHSCFVCLQTVTSDPSRSSVRFVRCRICLLSWVGLSSRNKCGHL